MRLKKLLNIVVGCALLFSVTACDLMKESKHPKTDDQFITEIMNQAKAGSIIDYNSKEVHLGAGAPKEWKKINTSDEKYSGFKDTFVVFRDVYESPADDAYAGLNKGKVEALFSYHRMAI